MVTETSETLARDPRAFWATKATRDALEFAVRPGAAVPH
jgi:hypothetical protein